MSATAVVIFTILSGVFNTRVMSLVPQTNLKEKVGILEAVLGLAAVVATISTVVWGVSNMDWYIPVGTFFLGFVATTLFMHPKTIGAAFFASYPLGAIAVAGALRLWFP